MALIDTTYLQNFVGSSSTLDGYSKSNSTAVTNAIAAATDMVRSAATAKIYSEASFDALTTSNAPELLQFVAAELALGILTAGDGGRPQNVTDGWNHAEKQLALLATGNLNMEDLLRNSQVRVGSAATVSANVFDKENKRTAANPNGSRFHAADPEI